MVIRTLKKNVKRQSSFYYKLRVNGEVFTVFIRMFLSLYTVSQQIEFEDFLFSFFNNQTPEDKRGKNINGNVIAREMCV